MKGDVQFRWFLAYVDNSLVFPEFFLHISSNFKYLKPSVPTLIGHISSFTLQGVQEKLCFSQFIAIQRNASVQSLLLAGNVLYDQQQPSAGEGEVAKFREFLEKTQYFMNTLYVNFPLLNKP